MGGMTEQGRAQAQLMLDGIEGVQRDLRGALDTVQRERDELALAQQDVQAFGLGILVDGKRVDPRTVRLVRPTPDKEPEPKPKYVRGSATSKAAALAWPRRGQRLRVLRELDAVVMGTPAGIGLTREELAGRLQLSENSIRPRVAELIEGGWITAAQDAEGKPMTRLTAAGQRAEVLRVTRVSAMRLQGDAPQGR